MLAATVARSIGFVHFAHNYVLHDLGCTLALNQIHPNLTFSWTSFELVSILHGSLFAHVPCFLVFLRTIALSCLLASPRVYFDLPVLKSSHGKTMQEWFHEFICFLLDSKAAIILIAKVTNLIRLLVQDLPFSFSLSTKHTRRHLWVASESWARITFHLSHHVQLNQRFHIFPLTSKGIVLDWFAWVRYGVSFLFRKSLQASERR